VVFARVAVGRRGFQRYLGIAGSGVGCDRHSKEFLSGRPHAEHDQLSAGKNTPLIGASLPDSTRVARRNAHHAPVRTARAEERAAARAEFAQGPTGVDPFEHGRYKGALEIAARGQ
jgi:hypothetical protein